MPMPLVATDTVPGLLQRLHIMIDQDAEVDRQLKRWTAIMTACWIGAVLLLFLAVALPIVGLTLGIPCLIAAIYATVQHNSFKGVDIENRRLLLPLRFFEIMGRDIPRKRKCSLNVNFDGYLKHGRQVGKSGNVFTVRTSEYEDQWLTAKGSLCDDTFFRVSIVQQIKRKEKPKRKYTKVSERITEKIKLTLRLSPQAYPDWAQLVHLLQPGSIPDAQFACTVNNGTVRVIAQSPPTIRQRDRSGEHLLGEHYTTGDTLLQLFLCVYAQLQHCRGAQSAADV